MSVLLSGPASRLTGQCTHVTGLEVGFLGADQERRVGDGSVSVLHLLILLFVFVLMGGKQFRTTVRYENNLFFSF